MPVHGRQRRRGRAMPRRPPRACPASRCPRRERRCRGRSRRRFQRKERKERRKDYQRRGAETQRVSLFTNPHCSQIPNATNPHPLASASARETSDWYSVSLGGGADFPLNSERQADCPPPRGGWREAPGGVLRVASTPDTKWALHGILPPAPPGHPPSRRGADHRGFIGKREFSTTTPKTDRIRATSD